MSEFDVIHDVSSWPAGLSEALGASEKVWLQDPSAANEPQHHWLFKPVTEHQNGTVQGGNWAELLASKIARMLGIPSAEIRLAKRDDVQGTLSRNVRPSNLWDLYEGDLWLDADTRADYSREGATPSKRDRGAGVGHHLDALAVCLSELGAPPQAEGVIAEWNGFEVFTSYLFLDALISNRDRHEQNWGVLRPATSGGSTMIAAAFDQEGGLGYNLTDDYRSKVLANPGGVERWANKGTAWRLQWSNDDHDRVPTLVEAARRAASMCRQEVATHLVDVLTLMTTDDVGSITASIPTMSEVARTFCIDLIATNSERLDHEFRDIAK